jgi:hypothetical protein
MNARPAQVRDWESRFRQRRYVTGGDVVHWAVVGSLVKMLVFHT